MPPTCVARSFPGPEHVYPMKGKKANLRAA